MKRDKRARMQSLGQENVSGIQWMAKLSKSIVHIGNAYVCVCVCLLQISYFHRTIGTTMG